jgi:hypothetical protein
MRRTIASIVSIVMRLAPHGLAQLRRAIVGGQLDVEAGVEGQRRRLGAVEREIVVLVQQADADVVGDDQAVEAPLLPEHLGQQAARGMARLVVDVVVGGHHGSRMRLLHRHLERQQEAVVQLAPPEMHRSMVARALAPGVPREVLQRREQIARLALQPANVPRGQDPDEIRVLAEGLLRAAPSDVA